MLFDRLVRSWFRFVPFGRFGVCGGTETPNLGFTKSRLLQRDAEPTIEDV